ncbi:MAG: hypothetical protein B7O98_09285 [Zestosphaera tikiterensis]|uniref:Uncharacterized protein n=1 Tax=Zestosphaera tikiterensis TaxID=1973259 RepID=A0A2R7Y202_9CREN|nr:MAG: hypothetical protein B7O98_09285 [Zestosphaera tikiterensis]
MLSLNAMMKMCRWILGSIKGLEGFENTFQNLRKYKFTLKSNQQSTLFNPKDSSSRQVIKPISVAMKPLPWKADSNYCLKLRFNSIL